MAERIIRMAQVGYGMFGSDVVAGTMWDLQRNGIAPYLDRVGLDDYADAYADVKFEMVAIGTRSKASAERACAENERETGIRPRAYFGDEPWETILSDFSELDLLIVATPDHLHATPTIAALNAGVHVVVEKPMCLKLEEAETIIKLAADKGLIVGVDMHKRYDPDHKRIFEELVPQLGMVLYARGVLEEPLEVSAYTFKWAVHSDPFTYVGVHWVDLFCHYLKLEPLALYAIGQKGRLLKEFNKDTFDATQVVVTHTNGVVVIYENNWITPADFEGPVNQESFVVGTLGKVESDTQYRGLRYWLEGKGSRTANTHFVRKVARPDGSATTVGYGKDSLIDCIEKVCRVAFLGVKADELTGTYPDAPSQRHVVSIIDAARQVMRRNWERIICGEPPTVTASFINGHIQINE